MEETLERYHHCPPIMEETFNRLGDIWENDTRYFSFYYLAQAHEFYNAIRPLGSRVVPLIIRRLYRDENASPHWYFLLTELSGEAIDYSVFIKNGVIKFTVEDLRQAWISWGMEKGYV